MSGADQNSTRGTPDLPSVFPGQPAPGPDGGPDQADHNKLLPPPEPGADN